MNRLEELAQIVCERKPTAGEIAELEVLLQDQANQQHFVALLDVHHGLVGLATPTGDAAETMAAIWRLEAREARRTVDADTGGRPRSRHTRRFPSRPRRRTSPMAGTFALLAACLVLAGLGVLLLQPAPAASPWHVLTGTLTADNRTSFAAGATLPLTTELVTAQPVELTSDDGIRITVRAGSRLHLQALPNLHLHLHAGEAVATVTGRQRPFAIGTSLATMSVTGTRFRVIAEADRCRLEVSEGTVTFAASRTVFCGADDWAEAIRTPGGIEVRNGSLRPPPSVPAVPATPATPDPAPPAVLRIEAERHTEQSGATIVPGGSGEKIGWLSDGDWLRYAGVAFPAGGSRFEIHQSSMRGGRIEIRLDALDGPLIGTIDIRHTGDWESFATLTAAVPATTGTHDVFLVIRSSSAEPSLVDIDWIQVRPSEP